MGSRGPKVICLMVLIFQAHHESRRIILLMFSVFAVLIFQARLQMHVYTSTSASENREFGEDFLLELMMRDDVPMDTRYVFIDPSCVACVAHAKQRVDVLERNLSCAFQHFIVFADPRALINLALESISLPDHLRAAPDGSAYEKRVHVARRKTCVRSQSIRVPRMLNRLQWQSSRLPQIMLVISCSCLIIARKLGFATTTVASCIVGLVYLLLELNLNCYREFRSTWRLLLVAQTIGPTS